MTYASICHSFYIFSLFFTTYGGVSVRASSPDELLSTIRHSSFRPFAITIFREQNKDKTTAKNVQFSLPVRYLCKYYASTMRYLCTFYPTMFYFSYLSKICTKMSLRRSRVAGTGYKNIMKYTSPFGEFGMKPFGLFLHSFFAHF